MAACAFERPLRADEIAFAAQVALPPHELDEFADGNDVEGFGRRCHCSSFRPRRVSGNRIVAGLTYGSERTFHGLTMHRSLF